MAVVIVDGMGHMFDLTFELVYLVELPNDDGLAHRSSLSFLPFSLDSYHVVLIGVFLVMINDDILHCSISCLFPNNNNAY
jgi:hypothetical protein